MKQFFFTIILVVSFFLIGIGTFKLLDYLWSKDNTSAVQKTDKPARPIPPEFFTLGGREWHLVFGYQHFSDGDKAKVDDYLNKKGRMAETSCRSGQILVHTGFILSEERGIILHELLHAEACQAPVLLRIIYYNSIDEEDHEGIQHIADFLNDLHHNDPEMVKYLEND